MPTPSGLVTKQELIDAQLDTAHLGRVVNSKDASGNPITTSTNRTGGTNKTLDALEADYNQSIATKQAEADAAIDEFRLTNKGPYAAGITLASKFEYITYNGESYFATTTPYTTTATPPAADTNLFIGGYTTIDAAAQVFSNKNLIPNSDFSVAGSVANAPDATPRSYSADDELFQGFKAVSSLSGVTYVNGKLNGPGQLYVDVYKTEKQKLSTAPHVASIALSDSVPVESGASFSDNGDYWRVTFDMSDTFSVKLEQGSTATRHELQTVGVKIYKFNTVSEMSKYDIEDGSGAEVSGYYNIFDGVSPKFIYSTDSSFEFGDIQAPNGIYKLQISSNKLYASHFGARLNGSTDDVDVIYNIGLRFSRFNSLTWTQNSPYYNLIIDKDTFFSKSLYFGWRNISLVVTNDAEIKVNLDTFVGDQAIDFDYSLKNAFLNNMTDVLTKASLDGVNEAGNNAFNLRNFISIHNISTGLSWPNNTGKTAREVAWTFISNPLAGDVISISGRKVTFGTDVVIGGDLTVTRDNLLTWLSLNNTVDFFSISTNAIVCYQANPALSWSDTASVGITRWSIGTSAIRQSNAWNCHFIFNRCNNFPTQVFENPVSKVIGGNLSEFGSENNRYDYGKSYNNQVVHWVEAYREPGYYYDDALIPGANQAWPYTIDTTIVGGSVKIDGLYGDTGTNKHYVFAINTKTITMRCDNTLDCETSASVSSDHSFVLINGDRWLFDNYFLSRVEVYKRPLEVLQNGWEELGEPNDNNVALSFRDYRKFTNADAWEPVRDNTKRKANYTSYNKYRPITNVDTFSSYTHTVFALGKLGAKWDASENKVVGMNFYPSGSVTPEAGSGGNISGGQVRVDQFKGVGVQINNYSEDSARLRFQRRVDPTIDTIVRVIDLNTGLPISEGDFSVNGTYTPAFLGFLDGVDGNDTSEVTIPANHGVQYIMINGDQGVNLANVYSLLVTQVYGENPAYAVGYAP